MRSNEQKILDQLLLHREFSVVAKLCGDANIHAAIARCTGVADNGNQYWVSIKDGLTRYEACIVGDWEFDSMIGALNRIAQETGGLLSGSGAGIVLNPQTADGLWLAPNGEVMTLMKVALSFVTGNDLTGTGEEVEHGSLFHFGLHTTSQQLLVQVEGPNDIGLIERRRYDALGGQTPNVVISRDALHCLMEVTLGDTPEFGLLRYPRRDWIVGFTDIAGRPTVDEFDFAVRSIEERLDRAVAEEAINTGALMLLRALRHFRTVEAMHRISREVLLAHLFAGHVGQAIQDYILQGHPIDFIFDRLRVLDQEDHLKDYPNAMAILLMPAAVLAKSNPEGSDAST